MYSQTVSIQEKSTFLYESQVFDAILIRCYNLLLQGIIFRRVIGPKVIKVLQHFFLNCGFLNKISRLIKKKSPCDL